MYGGVTGTQPPYRLELLLPDFKLDGPTTYLSWLYQITGALEGRGLDGYLTEEEKEPHVKMSSEWKAWRSTHTNHMLYCTINGLHALWHC